MAVLPIRIYPDNVLRQKAQPVQALDDALQHLIDDMIATMYAAPGIGLAAPQIGISRRLFVVDISSGREVNALMTFINPEWVHMEGRVQEDEGCLSFPEVYGLTPRAAQVRLRGTNRQGEMVEIAAEGLLARAFQHEMDHLDGQLFFHRMGQAGRDMVMRKFKRAQRTKQHRHGDTE